MNTNLSALVSTFHKLRQRYDALVLATIVETSGSTYRKAGARMLITPDAEFFGLLGGGCFEADLLTHTREVFERRQPKIVFYDMRAPEDEIWGLGLGCNGAVRILLQPLPTDAGTHAISLIEQALTDKEQYVLLTVCESNSPDLREGENHLLQFKGNHAINLPESWPDEIIPPALQAHQAGSSSLYHCQSGRQSITLFCSAIKLPWHLLIIGAGPDAMPVITFGKQLGWEITVVDYRESFLEQQSFAVEHTVLSPPEAMPEQVDLQRMDAIVLMTHKIEYDERYLARLTKSSAKYIGLLGPAARRDRLLASLGEQADLIRDRISGPVGLDTGGELPEEIALSLVAEIQARLYGRDGRPLHQKTTAVHNSEDAGNDDLHAVILAAGGARRFGRLKQLLEYRGKSLLRRSINITRSVLAKRPWVILGAQAHKVKQDMENINAQVIVNTDWESGIASSLKAGVAALPADCSAVLIVLCDQARITPAHLEKLCALWVRDKSKIVTSAYADTVGVPAVIPRNYFPAIMQLDGDRGAKSIITRFADNAVSVNIPEAACDIDTESDYRALLSAPGE